MCGDNGMNNVSRRKEIDPISQQKKDSNDRCFTKKKPYMWSKLLHSFESDSVGDDYKSLDYFQRAAGLTSTNEHKLN